MVKSHLDSDFIKQQMKLVKRVTKMVISKLFKIGDTNSMQDNV